MTNRTLRTLATAAAAGAIIAGSTLAAAPAEAAKWPHYVSYNTVTYSSCTSRASAAVQHMHYGGHQAAITTKCHPLKTNGAPRWGFTMGYAFG